ncbi:MAG: hypothetical protein JWO75_4590, partial [Actinomycetia bacterium]|nr:hypothetical protein [Actinomycetes bacterium]
RPHITHTVYNDLFSPGGRYRDASSATTKSRIARQRIIAPVPWGLQAPAPTARSQSQSRHPERVRVPSSSDPASFGTAGVSPGRPARAPPGARRFSSCPSRACRGPAGGPVSRLACPCDVFSGGVGRCDRGSSGCAAPEGRPVRRLCPGLRVLRAGCFRDRGSSGADIATFDPQSRDSPVMVVGLFCFMAVRRRSAGCSPAVTRGHGPDGRRPPVAPHAWEGFATHCHPGDAA